MRLVKVEIPEKLKKKPRVCAYARVSTGSKGQEMSLENQIESYERMIRGNADYEFAGVYADRGVTGRLENRPEFQRMITDARSGKIDLIYTKSISRFARNTVVLLKYVRELRDHGIGVIFEENDINTLTSEGEMMMTVLASFAQEESRSMKENNRWALQKKFARGEVMINTNRFMGYDKDNSGKLVINEEEAKIVRRIFDMYLSGMGTHRIAKALNADGVKTVTGAKWRDSVIGNMLRNEKYKGACLLQKCYTPEGEHHSRINKGEETQYYIPEDHEAIVPPEDWEEVQKLMEYNKKSKNIGSGAENYHKRYPNSKKLICPHCGKYLHRRIVYAKRVEWLCSTYIHEGKTACPGIRISDGVLGGRVFAEPTVVEEVMIDGSKHYRYTRKEDYDKGIRGEGSGKKESRSVLPGIHGSRRAAIKL